MDDSTPNLSNGADNNTPQKNACVTCARRKVKCNRQEPCSNCVKSNIACNFTLRTTASRTRKRPAAEEDVYARLHRYEELLRKNNIDISPPDNWIHTTIKQQDGSLSTLEITSLNGTSNEPKPVNEQQNWWAELSDELKNPTEHQLPLTQTHGDLSSAYDSSVPASPDTASLLFGTKTGSRLPIPHPIPNMIFKIWQYFLENVNPLLKVIHVPTMQQEILKAIDNLQEIDKAQEALMFSIYAIVVASMSAADCLYMFAYEKTPLLAQFRNAAQQALINADFTRTKDFKVLQAFLLFMLCDPDSEETFILSTVAVRVAQRLGINGKDNPDLSVFENEMRLRMWWQLVFLDARAAMARPNVCANTAASDLDGIRLPRNVNDSELYPEMSESPREYGRVTDMVCCLMKYEANSVIRRSKYIPPHARGLRRWTEFNMSLAEKDEMIDAVAELWQKKYLQYCDPKVPLHSLAILMAKLGISRMRFRAHHPRNNADWSTPEESETIFFHSVRLLEYDNQLRQSKFPQQLVRHLTARIQLDALICVLTGLRRRTTGGLVENAWQQIEIFYRDHALLVDDTDNTLYTAIGDLALKAWRTRISSSRIQTTPDFILKLLHRRSEKDFLATGSQSLPANFTEPPPMVLNETQNRTLSPNIAHNLGLSLDTPDVDWSFWDGLLAEPGFGSYGQEILGYSIGP